MEKSFIDSHCHLDDNAETFIANAESFGVGKFLAVGADRKTSERAVALSEKFSDRGVFSSIGVHPHDAEKMKNNFAQEFQDLIGHSRVVAVGETGLDYFYDHSPRDVQKEVFRDHIRAARELKLPIILHIRDAMPDALSIMDEENAAEAGGMFHCYAGGLEYLSRALDFGYYISFTGVITYPKNDELREVARIVPIEKILCETDCPWLAPVPFRGKLNEPANVRFVYETIAKVRNIGIDELAVQVEKNFSKLFLDKDKKNV